MPKPLDSFTSFVLDQLSALPGVSSQRMFGGIGLRLSGAFFAVIDDGKLYFRTDESTRKPYLEAGCDKFMPTEEMTIHSYFEVPAGVLEDPEELCAWAKTAAATQAKSPTKKSPAKKTPAKKKPVAKPRSTRRPRG